MKWIKCSDRMPKIGEDVLVFSTKNGVFHALFTKNECWSILKLQTDKVYRFFNDITHWIPLPEEPDAPEIEGEPTDTDRLRHVYGLIHNTYCPNNEYMTESPELHHDYSCEFILGLINKRENNSGDTP